MDVTLVSTAVKDNSDARQGPILAPQLFLILESRRPLALSARSALDKVDEVIIGRGRQRSIERRVENQVRQLIIRVPDPWLSSQHARIERRAWTFAFSDTNSTNGSLINGVPATSATLQDGDILELGQTFFVFRAQMPMTEQEPQDLDASQVRAPQGIVSLIPSLAQRFFELGQVCKTSTSVVILGQTGSGKEVVARASHALSGRSGAFVAVNCGALPDSLVESEFFGHKKGSFSGANEDRQGLVVAADRGTLFLDEIGDLPLASQAALLRVLQEREVTPVGATTPIRVDFRLVCATHRNMEALVREGTFREDLLARLNGFVIELPPLAERMEDLGLLIGTLLGQLTAGQNRELAISNEAMRALLSYHWPRNIRELRTCLQTALALAGDEKIGVAHLSQAVRGALQGGAETESRELSTSTTQSRSLSPEQSHRREQLIQLLREHQGNISAVARSMGKVRSQVQRWLKRYGLDPEAFRG